MSDFNITTLSINFFDYFKFNFPKNANITDIKIYNFNIYTKILPKNKLALHGSYEASFIFNINLKNNNYKKIKKHKKTNFFKIFIAKPYNKSYFLKNINISIETLLPVKYFYSIKNNRNCMYSLNDNNICTIYLFALLEIKLNPNNDIRSTNNLVTPNSTIINNFTPFNSLQTYNDKFINTSTHVTENIPLNSHNDYLTDNKKNSKKLIQCNTIIGRGSIDYFINENIVLPPEIPSIWIIEEVNTSVEVTKLDLIKDKAVVSGFININVIYKIASANNLESNLTISGNLEHIYRQFPFSTFINLEAECNTQICSTDTCQLINAKCLSEIHTLKVSSTTSFGEIVYNEILEQLLIKIDVLITRSEEIYI